MVLAAGAARADESHIPLAIPGEPIPASAPPATVFAPQTLRGAFRVPRTDTALYIAAPWFVRDISITIVGPDRHLRTLVADTSLPGRTLGLRLPFDAPSAERIELTANTVSVAGVPYLVSADQLATISSRNWWYAVAFGAFGGLALIFGWFALRRRSSAGAWYAALCAAQALLMVPWLGVVRPPPVLSQPLHGVVQAFVFVALALFAVILCGAVRLSHRARIALAVLVELNALCWIGADLQQDLWFVPDVITQFLTLIFDGALLLIGIAALRRRVEGAGAFVAGVAFATVGFALDAAGPNAFLRTAAVSGNLLQALLFAAALAPRLREVAVRGDGTDGLTAIANRATLDAALIERWNRAQGAGTPLSALLIDIDHFKAYNDAYGHLAGDDALRRVAFEIDHVAQRNAGLAGRYAGDKFLIVIAERPHDIVLRVGDAARSAVAGLQIAHTAAPSRRVSVTVGVATMTPQHPGDGGELMLRAGTALHLAKSLGRDRVVAADPVGANAPA